MQKKTKIPNLFKRFRDVDVSEGEKGEGCSWCLGAVDAPLSKVFVYRERKVRFKISGGEVLASGHKRQLMPFLYFETQSRVTGQQQ